MNKTGIIHLMIIFAALIPGGCTHSIKVADLSQYDNEPITITTTDSIKYELGEGWQIDSLNYISGRGSKSFSDSTIRFYGTIRPESINKITVSSESKTLIIGVTAFTVLVTAFIMNNRH